MIYERLCSRKSLLIFFLLFLLSQIVFPPVVLSKDVVVDSDKDRVLFMVAEKHIEDTHFYYWWSSSFWGTTKGKTEYKAEVTDISSASTALAGAFIKAGFIVVDPSAIEGEVEIKDAYRIEDLTAENTTGFGKVLGADIVVKGRAIARKGIKDEGAKLGVYMADVTARAIRVSDGRVLASATGHGVSRHISPTSGPLEALSLAGEDAAAELMAQMGAD